MSDLQWALATIPMIRNDLIAKGERVVSLYNFKRGQKVICINDIWYNWGHPTENYPEKGRIYTIRVVCPDNRNPDKIWYDIVQLEEINNPITEARWPTLSQAWWSEQNFRPLEWMRPTDISVFENIFRDAEKSVS